MERVNLVDPITHRGVGEVAVDQGPQLCGKSLGTFSDPVRCYAATGTR